jgi:hypothetical protein
MAGTFRSRLTVESDGRRFGERSESKEKPQHGTTCTEHR